MTKKEKISKFLQEWNGDGYTVQNVYIEKECADLMAEDIVNLFDTPDFVRQSCNDNDISKLKKGDYVRFSKEVKPIPKNFTIGKTYKILDKRQNESWRHDGLQIRHDKGGVYWIPLSNTYKRWSCA